MSKKCTILHKWKSWSHPKKEYTGVYQHRYCSICNQMRIRLVCGVGEFSDGDK
jgi:hypothetical protein